MGASNRLRQPLFFNGTKVDSIAFGLKPHALFQPGSTLPSVLYFEFQAKNCQDA